MQQCQIDIALFHRIIDLCRILPIQLASICQEVGLRDRIGWDFPAHCRADEVIDILRTAVKRLIRIWFCAMDQVDVYLYGVCLRFVVWTEVGAETGHHLLQTIGEHLSLLVALGLMYGRR